MGRRKIEIQPITHERNRSVTFLKRKNGLFKKAYELGVLCSVEVAVIIFEEKPGHGCKCYQYGSDDVKSIIQRHVRFEGEKDSKGPSDFSNNKAGDIVDGEEDEVDEEEESVVNHSRKRSDSGAIKPSSHKSKPEVKVEASSSRTIDIADHHPTPSHSRPNQSPADQSRSLSNSADRMSKHSSDDLNDHSAHKRPRLGYISEDVRAADVRAFNTHGLAPYGYHPSLHPLTPQSSAGGHASSLPIYNGTAPIGGQSSSMFDLFRNPGNMRAFNHMYPSRPPPNVSEAFLASLNEVAQQGGVGCGIGGVGGGMGGFEWSSAGYQQGSHHGDHQQDSSWLDLLTGGSSNNGPPPAHASPPHGHNHHQQWSSASSSRSDSSMSNNGLPLGLNGGAGVLAPRLSVGSNRPSSADIMDTKGIL